MQPELQAVLLVLDYNYLNVELIREENIEIL